jgi:hypothetical protein
MSAWRPGPLRQAGAVGLVGSIVAGSTRGGGWSSDRIWLSIVFDRPTPSRIEVNSLENWPTRTEFSLTLSDSRAAAVVISSMSSF